MELPAEEIQNEKQDSIEISRTAKGTYTWKIKRYYDHSKTTPEMIIKQVEEIDRELKKKFREQ